MKREPRNNKKIIRLTDDEYKVIKLKSEGKNQGEIVKILKMNQTSVSRLYTSALSKLFYFAIHGGKFKN